RTVAASDDPAQARIRGVHVDARSLERETVAPQGVVVSSTQHDWTVGDGTVQPPGIKLAVRGQSRVVAGTDDPVRTGMFGRPSPHFYDDVVDTVQTPDLWSLRLQATQQRMCMAITERRHEEATLEVDD